MQKMRDIFICHASEDKDVVYPILSAFNEARITYWYDEGEIKWGDSITQQVNVGLVKSRYVVVVFSPAFMSKNWPQRELSAVLNQEASTGAVKVLPLLVGNEEEKKQILAQFPLLSDKRYLPWDGDPITIVKALLARLETEEASVGSIIVAARDNEGVSRPTKRGYPLTYKSMTLGVVEPSFGIFNVEILCHQTQKKSHVLKKSSSSAKNRDSCSFRVFNTSTTTSGSKLEMEFYKTSYYDFLGSRNLLSKPFPEHLTKSYREYFIDRHLVANDLRGHDFGNFPLSNICGAGLFIFTTDNNVVISKHRASSHVYPNRQTYAASGTLCWGDWPSPFTEMLAHAREEINYQVDPRYLYLFDVGVDVRELYFQCSLIDKKSDISSDEILTNAKRVKHKKHSPENLYCISFQPSSVVDSLFEDAWEPAAYAALKTLCQTEHSRDRDAVEREFQRVWKDWESTMIKNWQERGSRPNELADMSVRYTAEKLSTESTRYIEAIMAFMSDDFSRSKTVVEVGCGTGRLTQRLLQYGGLEVTCLEFCEAMLQRHRQRLGAESSRVKYFENFAQYYECDAQHDIAISSMVLIHNVADTPFRCLVESLCRMGKTIFVFEDTGAGRKTSTTTRLRTEDELAEAFAVHDYEVVRRSTFRLFDDHVSFLELRKCLVSEAPL